jgi:hypothetical protein
VQGNASPSIVASVQSRSTTLRNAHRTLGCALGRSSHKPTQGGRDSPTEPACAADFISHRCGRQVPQPDASLHHSGKPVVAIATYVAADAEPIVEFEEGSKGGVSPITRRRDGGSARVPPVRGTDVWLGSCVAYQQWIATASVVAPEYPAAESTAPECGRLAPITVLRSR